MSQKFSLSIIIPVYNEEDYIEACLRAIAAQTDAPDEVIVVDNNSTDRTAEIAKNFPFVKVLRAKKQGVLHARNKGFDAAKGDIIGRIDADTVLQPEWVETVKRVLADRRYAAATGPVFYYDMLLGKRNYWLDHKIRLNLYKGAPDVPFLFGSNSALRRAAWEKVRSGVCDSREVHEDLDLAIHLAQSGQKIIYDGAMTAGTSARRYDDSFSSWRHYMAMYYYSYQSHGIKGFPVRIAMAFYWAGYLVLRWFRPGRTKGRKNPMSH